MGSGHFVVLVLRMSVEKGKDFFFTAYQIQELW